MILTRMVSLEQDQAQSASSSPSSPADRWLFEQSAALLLHQSDQASAQMLRLGVEGFLSHWSTTTGCCWQLCQAGVASGSCSAAPPSLHRPQSSNRLPGPRPAFPMYFRCSEFTGWIFLVLVPQNSIGGDQQNVNQLKLILISIS